MRIAGAAPAVCALLAFGSSPAVGDEDPPQAVEPPPQAVEAPPPSRSNFGSTVSGRDTRPGRTGTDAVEVVDTTTAREESSGLDAVLDRTKGVVLRRSGGLGSPTTFLLQGLSGNRVRFFVDGVPADVSGLGENPMNIPLHLLDRVEIFKGVVPIRFGADALGGAVNFVTRDDDPTARLEASAELASFGTFRGSAVGVVPLVERLRLYARPSAWFDRADNDYPIDVQIADERGQLRPATVRRFHDRFQSYGLGLELGVRGVSFADRLTVRAFHSGMTRDLQSNVRVTVPYGDVTLGNQATGVTLHYLLRDRPTAPVGVEALLTWATRDGSVDDVSRNIWSWDGTIIGARAVPGERGGGSRVRTALQSVTGRLTATWRAASHSRLELGATPSFAGWTQRSQSAVAPDLPWSETRYRQTRVVAGASWQLRLFGARLRNELFAKYYHQRPEGPPPSGIAAPPPPEPSHHGGGGDALRLQLWGPLLAKASYEYATRIPDATELFGDGAQVTPNASLRPETSHNVNAALVLDGWQTPVGRIEAEADFFYRRTRDLIFLTVALDSAQYQNISDVDTTGVEGALGWTGWNIVSLSANATLLNSVSRATGGFFGRFQGDRIPNLPYLFANFAASVALPLPSLHLDRVRAYWYGHYVHEYFLFWESEGDPAHKLRVPEQFTQTAGLSVSSLRRRLTASFEVHNLADARNYDNVGQQLAGRSFHLKLIVGID